MRVAPIAAVLLLVPIMLSLGMLHTSAAEKSGERTLSQARAEADPVKRIELLEEAGKDASVKGETLGAVFFQTALAYKELNDYFRAIENFDYSLAYSRNSIPALLEKTHCLILLDQLDEASNVLETVLVTASASAQAYVLKGIIYEKEGSLAKAEDEFTRALNFDSTSSAALNMRAKVLLKEGKPLRALDDVNALVRMAPNQPDVFLARARIHVKLNDYHAALDDYHQVEQLSPGDDKVIKERVLVFFKMDQPRKALDALSTYAARHAEDSEVMVLKARAHLSLSHYAQAERILKAALATNPLYAPAHLYHGVVLMKAHDLDRALANLNLALELDATLVEAYKERARVFVTLGEPVRAAADLTAAANLDASDGEIPAMRGLTFMERMLYDAATLDFSKALESLPGDPRILYDRAVAYVMKGENEPALHDIEAVLRVKPRSAQALCMRGVVLFNLGNVNPARYDFQKAVEIDPNDPLIWNNRGYFLYKMGERMPAMESFNRALQLKPGYGSARRNLDVLSENQDGQSPSTEVGEKTQPSTTISSHPARTEP